MNPAVTYFVADSLHSLPDPGIVNYSKGDWVEDFIFLAEVFLHYRPETSSAGDEPCLKLLESDFVKQYYQTGKVVDFGSDINMVAFHGPAKANPATPSQVRENDVILALNVFFHGGQMLNDVHKFAKF